MATNTEQFPARLYHLTFFIVDVTLLGEQGEEKKMQVVLGVIKACSNEATDPCFLGIEDSFF